jgi:hypothetical protein
MERAFQVSKSPVKEISDSITTNRTLFFYVYAVEG